MQVSTELSVEQAAPKQGYSTTEGTHAIVLVMKSPLLILFIIFNLLAVSMASAGNLYDEQLSESQLVVSQINDSAALANCMDESSCSDFCHVSSHMVGVTSHLTPSVSKQTSLSFFILNESFHSITLDPPQQPPISLI